jgi:hypothetical protein
MRFVRTTCVALGVFVLSTATDLKAVPIGRLSAGAGSDLVLVAQGCGAGWHRGPFGGCRRNLSPAWPCWWTRGPFGGWHLVCH